MRKGSDYARSQDTLMKFAAKFNSISTELNLYCCPIITETMLNDGCFIDVGLGKLFSFDWEIRSNFKKPISFAPGAFDFPTLTEFERKFSPDKNTQLFIQCDTREEYIAVGWREDFRETDKTRRVLTDKGKAYEPFRETPHFKAFKLDDLTEFKKTLNKAFKSTTYNHTIF